MELRLLEIFLEVVRSGSFASAARNLDQDPSSVSRSIAMLENDIGVRLFQRTTRKLSLTEAGNYFAAKIEPVLAELDQTREDIQSHTVQPRGKLCVSASVAFGQVCVMPHTPTFLNRYPEIDLELKFTDRNVDLVSERVDLAIRLGPAVSADVIAAKLITTRYRVCASPEYLRKRGPLAEPADLKDHRCICFDLPDFRDHWFFKKAEGTVKEVKITPRIIASGALALREAALLHMGPALLADWLISGDLKQERLVDLFPDYDVTATSFDTAAWLLYPSRSFLPRKTRVMIDFLRETLTSKPMS